MKEGDTYAARFAVPGDRVRRYHRHAEPEAEDQGQKMSLSVAILTSTLAAASSSARLCQTQNTTNQKGLSV